MKNTKRIAAIGLAAMLSGCMLGNTDTLGALSESLAITANAATASGTCGTGLNWSLSGDTLTITGTGTTMKNYARYSNMAPWRTYASQIKKVYFPKTLKSIGSYAFYNMTALEYVYTKDGYNKPCLPDLTSIGDYAFAECYAFYGCTSNGVLTLGLGTSSVMTNGTVTVKDSAFMNCDRVRFLKCNYKTMIVEEWGFCRMDALTTLSMSNTKLQLGKSAFNGCSNLASVSFLPSVLPIHSSAFNNTKYYSNGCTNAAFYGQNDGNAKKMTGNQLIVNIFLDMTKVNTEWAKHGVENGSASYIFSLLDADANKVAAKAGASEAGFSQPKGAMQYYAFDKNNITYEHIYSWNAKKSSAQTNNTVVSLNKLDYTTLANPSKISKSIVDNSESSGFFGCNVTSADIQQRLAAVRSAANDLEVQAKNYTTKSLKFEMHPETNFYLTYDSFDWTTTKMTFNGKTYDVMGGYSEQAHHYLCDGVKLIENSKNPVFSSIKKASQQHSGGVTQTIDLFTSSGSILSSYTTYLKQHYGVDGVVYLFHFKVEGQSFTIENSKAHKGIDECVFVRHHKDASQQRLCIEHEMSHMYGAIDYYDGSCRSQDEVRFCRNYFSEDIMFCDYSSNSTLISPATAYSIGWLDRLDSTVFNNVFYSLKKS